MNWGKIKIDEVEVDLTHLDPFTINVTPAAPGSPTYKVLVSFSHHAFTRDLVDTDLPKHYFGPAHDVRCFCADRHRLSLSLPEIVKAAATGKAYFPARNHPVQRNFLLVKIAADEPPYLIVFNLERARGVDADAVMNIVSAHPRPGLGSTRKMASIRLATLVSKTVRGERVVRPS